MISLWLPIPGRVGDGTAYLDIETRKVECHTMLSDGWILKKRWSAFATGVVSEGAVHINATYDEPALLRATAEAIGRRTVAYAATRQFDEMVFKGRFTNARRSHEDFPFFPSMPGAKGLRWNNILRQVQNSEWILERATDVPSKDVPDFWCTDQRDMVLVHLLRDVLELVYHDGKANAQTRAWIRQVLFSNEYAINLIQGAPREEQ